MGALSVLSLKSNCLCNKEAGKVLAEMLAANTVLKELDLSDNTGHGARDGAGFAQELALGIRDNGTMTSLNLALNNLGSRGAKIVAEAIKKVINCIVAIILVPLSCPSDSSINCCYLLLSAGNEGTIVSKSCQQHPWGF
jgi:hypothetical protein